MDYLDLSRVSSEPSESKATCTHPMAINRTGFNALRNVSENITTHLVLVDMTMHAECCRNPNSRIG
jgi:hypothetical protein